MNQKNIKRTAIVALSACCMACAAIGFAACGGTGLPEEKPSGDYSFENSVARLDSNVTLDGNLNESFWNETAPYYYRLEVSPNYFVELTAKVHFGENGIYFGIDVDDDNVNYHESRRATQNSGVEMMFAAGNSTQVEGEALRYIVNAGGKTTFAKYTDGDYIDWLSEKSTAPRSATVLKGGEIGSGTCTGYRSEVFIPKKHFGGEIPDSVKANFGLICTASSTTQLDRTYKNLGGIQTSASWTNPQTWFSFGENGFESNAVILQEAENGSITSDFDYSLPGMKTNIVIMPAAGYRPSSVTKNGQSLDLTTFGRGQNGEYIYTHVGTGEDVTFVAEFVNLPENKYGVSGKITVEDFEGAPTIQELYDAIKSFSLESLWMIYGEVRYEVSGDEIVYSVPEVYEGQYRLIAKSQKDFAFFEEEISVTGGDIVKDISIDKLAWTGIRNYKLNDALVTANTGWVYLSGIAGDQPEMWQGTMSQKTFLFGGRMAGPIGTVAMSGELVFFFEGTGDNNFVRIQLGMIDNVFKATIVSYHEDQEMARVSQEIPDYQAAYANGGDVVVSFDNGEVQIYLKNGGEFEKVASASLSWLNSVQLLKVAAKKDGAQAGDKTLTVKYAAMRTNDLEIENFYNSLEAIVDIDTEYAQAISDFTQNQESYLYGDTVTVSFSAKTTAYVNVTLNGAAVELQKRENGENTVYTYTFIADFENRLAITAFEPVELSGTVSVNGSEYTAQQIKDGIVTFVLSADGKDYIGTLTAENGVLTYSVLAPAGNYTIKLINEFGYEYTANVSLETANTKAIEITQADWENIKNPETGNSSVATKTNGIYISDAEGDTPVAWEGKLDTNKFIFGGVVGGDFTNTLNVALLFFFDDSAENSAIRVGLKSDKGNLTPHMLDGHHWSTVWGSNWNNASAYRNGGGIIVTFDKGVVTVYLENTDGRFEIAQTFTISDGWISSARLIKVAIKNDAQDSVGDGVITLTDTHLRTNDLDVNSFARLLKTSLTVDTENATGISGLTGNTENYSLGDEVTVSFTAANLTVVTVSLNGGAVTPQTQVNGDNTTYTITFRKHLTDELVITAFEPVELSGTISLTGGSLTAQEIKEGIVRLTLSADGRIYECSLTMAGDEVRYSVLAPAGEYKLKLVNEFGYELSKNISLTENQAENLSVTESAWKNVKTLTATDSSVTAKTDGINISTDAGDTPVAWEGKLDTNKFIFGGVVGGDFTNTLNVALLFFFDDSAENSAIRVGLKSDKGNLTPHMLDGHHWGTVWGGNWNNASAYRGGGGIIVTFDGETITVYLENAEGQFAVAQTLTVSDGWISASRLVKIAIKTDNDSEDDTSVALTGAKLRTNDLDVNSFARLLKTSLTVDTENATGISGLTGHDAEYRYGDSVTLSFTAANTTIVTAKLNGETVTLTRNESGADTTFSYTFTKRVKDVFTITAQKTFNVSVSVSVTGTNFVPVHKVLVKDSQNEETELESDGNSYSARFIKGTYGVYAQAENGVTVKLGDIIVENSDVSKSYTLDNTVTTWPIVLPKHTLSGSITVTGVEGLTAEQIFAGIQSIKLSNDGGASYTLKAAAEGDNINFTGTADEGEYTLTLTLVSGYVQTTTVQLTADMQNNISLSREQWLNIKTISATDSSVATKTNGIYISDAEGDTPVAWEGKLDTNKFIFGGTLGGDFSTTLNAALVFFFDAGGDNPAIRIGLTTEGGQLKSHVLDGKHWGTKTGAAWANESAYRNGGGIIVAFDGASITVYLENAEGQFAVAQTLTVEDGWIASSHLVRIALKTEQAKTVTLTDAYLRTNDFNVSTFAKNFNVSVVTDSANAEDIANLTGAGDYKHGDEVTISFSAAKTANIAVTLNGAVCEASSATENGDKTNYVYKFTARMKNSVVISVLENPPVTGTVTLRKTGVTPSAEGATLTFTDKADATHTLTVNVTGSGYSAALSAGTYTVTVGGNGFANYLSSEITVIDGETIKNLSFEYNTFKQEENGYDLSNQNVSDIEGYNGKISHSNPNWKMAVFTDQYSGDFVYGVRADVKSGGAQRLAIAFSGWKKSVDISIKWNNGAWQVKVDTQTALKSCTAVDHTKITSTDEILFQAARIGNQFLILVDNVIVCSGEFLDEYSSAASNVATRTAQLEVGMGLNTADADGNTARTFYYMISTDVSQIQALLPND